MEGSELTAFLQSHALFGGIADEDMPAVTGRLRAETFAPGEIIVREGDRPDRMYFILNGSAEVFVEAAPEIAADGSSSLRTLRTGDSFGEMGLIDTQPRAASVRALGTVETLSLSGPDMNRLYRENPRVFTMIVLNLARELSRRLRDTNRMLAEVRRNRADARP